MTRLFLHNKPLWLVSASPRRRQLLALLNHPFECIASDLNETPYFQQPPYDIDASLKQISLAKIQQASLSRKGIAIGADTVVLTDHTVWGKPQDLDHAREMLSALSGRAHHVKTGLAVQDLQTGVYLTDVVSTTVFFRNISDEEREDYLQKNSPYDKAGAYGIQDQAAIFIYRIEGCYYNVMGLPLSRLYELLICLETDTHKGETK